MNLTKTQYMAGLTCLRYLWFLVNDKSKIPTPTEAEQFNMSQGYEVQKYAEKLIQGESEKPFTADGLYARADIISNNCVYEVKASNSVKKDYADDISFQRYVYRKAGYNFDKYFIVHLNKDYVRKGEINPSELLIIHEVKTFTPDSEISENIRKMKEALSSCPKGECHGCPLEDCWEKPEIFEVRNAWKLYEEGILFIKDIPSGNTKQLIQKECAISGKPHIDSVAIKKWLDGLESPYYFDFETISTAVPLFDNCRPWQHVPFQFSCHSDKHSEFLYDGSGDPRLELLEAMKCLGSSGSIVVYYKSFEKTRLREMARDFPEYSSQIDNYLSRIVAFITSKTVMHDFTFFQGSANLFCGRPS